MPFNQKFVYFQAPITYWIIFKKCVCYAITCISSLFFHLFFSFLINKIKFSIRFFLAPIDSSRRVCLFMINIGIFDNDHHKYDVLVLVHMNKIYMPNEKQLKWDRKWNCSVSCNAIIYNLNSIKCLTIRNRNCGTICFLFSGSNRGDVWLFTISIHFGQF